MICVHCGLCCRRVNMPLTWRDISRLKKTNLRVKDFIVYKHGVYRLRNVNGYCFFYDKVKRRCKVYKLRPEGCRIYPVVWVKGLGVAVDKLCPMKHTITKKELNIKKRRLIRLVKTLNLNKV